MQTRVFTPLGMDNTTLDFDAALKSANRATPHSADLQAKHHLVDMNHERFVTFIRPSGGIWSTAHDMARYVIAEISKGKAQGGAQVASAKNLTHRWAPQVKISAKASYGLGWISADDRGLRTISHGGGTMGFGTLVSFIPDKGVGLVAISNGTGGHQVNAIIWRRLVELWFGAEPKASERLRYNMMRRDQELARLKARMTAPDKAFMAPYLGKHRNPEIGEVTISATKDGGYQLDAGEYKTGLKRYDRPDGKSVLIFTSPPLAGLQMVPIKDKPGQLEMKRAQERYPFKR